MKLRKLAALGLAGALLTVAACGDDDDTEAEGDGGGELAAPPEDTEATLRVWLNGEDTPNEMREWATDEFKKKYPNVKVDIETQEWDGLVDRLNGVLPTDDSPDIVELGNTQAQQFEAAGALVDLSSAKEDLGGDDLVDSLVESGTYNEQFYGLPLYGGSRIVTYRTDLFEASGIEIPETTEEFIEAGVKLKEDNAATPNFSGIYFPGRNWHAMLSFIWDAGGDVAVQEDGEWVNELGSDESVEGLTTVQEIMRTANSAPADVDDANQIELFCNGEIGMLFAPSWAKATIETDEEVGCPGKYDDVMGTFALPGPEGEPSTAFLGGSNLGISSNSQNKGLALEFLKIISGEEFQTQYADNGLIPTRKSVLESYETDDEALAAGLAAAENSNFIPASEHWAEVEEQAILQDMGTAIAEGGDVAEQAQKAGDAIVEILNQD